MIRRPGTSEEIATVLSDRMVENWIRVRAGDLLTVDFDEDPPQPRYRWRRVSVVSRDGDRVVVTPAPGNDSDATQEVSVGDQDPQVGDTVFLSGASGEPVVFDVAVDGEPSNLDRYADRIVEIRERAGR